MTEQPSEEQLALAGSVIEAVNQLYGGLQQISPDEEGAREVSRSQLAVLRVLADRGTCTMREVATAVGVTTPTMTSTIKLLVKRGWVERRHDEGDWRKVRVTLTERGTEAQSQAVSRRTRALAQSIQALPAEQRAMLMVALPALQALGRQVRSA